MAARFSARELTLKHGGEARVRLARPSDAAAILAVDRADVDAGVGEVLARRDHPRHAAKQVDRLRPTLEGAPQLGAILVVEAPPPRSSAEPSPGDPAPGSSVGLSETSSGPPRCRRSVEPRPAASSVSDASP